MPEVFGCSWSPGVVPAEAPLGNFHLVEEAVEPASYLSQMYFKSSCSPTRFPSAMAVQLCHSEQREPMAGTQFLVKIQCLAEAEEVVGVRLQHQEDRAAETLHTKVAQEGSPTL